MKRCSSGRGWVGSWFLSAFMRLDERLEHCKEWLELKDKSSGMDPLGPGGQPHFEFDFLVSFYSTASML